MKTTRRDWLMLTGLAAGTPLLAALSLHAAQKKDKSRFRLALNTSTIMGQNLDIVDEIETAAKAGYDAIEPWMGELYAYKEAGITNPREEISMMELHDCFSITELVTYEDLHISERGKAVHDVVPEFSAE